MVASRKAFVYTSLFLIFLFTVFIIFAQITLHRFGEEEQEALSTDVKPLAKIEVVSDVSGFTVRKNEIGRFDEILREWGIFEENNFFLYSLEQQVSLEKLVIHLTDKQQPYQFVYKGNTDEVINSVGENWEEKTKRLDLFLHADSTLLNNVQLPIVNQNFNGFVLIILYNRTHKGYADYIEKAKEYIDYFSDAGQFPFIVEKK